MTAIFALALGEQFERLHPMMKKRFGVGLDAGYACVGTGTMTRIRRGPWWTVPFLWIGRVRNILVPIQGTDVPFTVENFPYRDPLGRETVTFVRSYGASPRPHRFDATMIYSERAGRVIDYLGTHQHLAVDLDLRVNDDGSLLLLSDAQRFYEGPVAFRFPMLFSGRAELHESYDDAAQLYRIKLEVRNRWFGFLFGYEGTFSCTFPPALDAPAELKPVRHERRE
ncbi:DUF4166 domain-containing protein [Agreia sp. VKM Ac-1783]|uniref:DUF4166 domain-containing protein n=1 Tax=Agreia sp. VKM Ac-1783 TaxID=1938889 RepID=UPI000A2AD238|nr:DUF4166 domain-containing protein [Agreia sp. VKM Ac-1783]SMQ71643.1 protein of unknown function [Agreia sp. VKM Ac-1783]